MVDKAFKPPIQFDPKFNTPVEQKKDFSKTWLEFAATNREQIMRSGAIGSAQRVLFQVPDDTILFVTNVWGTIRSATAGDGIRMNLSNFADDRADFFKLHVGGNNTAQSIAINYPMPIKVPSGIKIDLAGLGSGNVSTHGGFVGFLVPFTA